MAAVRIDDANRRWWVLGATGASLAIVLLDETVVGVALPTIREDLDMSRLLSHWIVNAYMLVLTVVVAAAGRLGDVLGQRPAFVIGAVVFGLGSLGSGIAQSGEWILVSRAVQGIGGAFLFAVGAAITAMAFSDSERGYAFGIYGVWGTIGLALGPFVGGLLTELVSWRLIFFVNLPLVVAVVVMIHAAYREPVAQGSRATFDSRGLLAWAAVLGPLVLALMQAPDWGWGSPVTIALLAASALALPLFVLAETRTRDPLLEVNLLTRPTVVGANLALLCGQFAKVAVIVFGALYLQERLDFSPIMAGLALVVAMAPLPILSPFCGRVTDRFGPRRPLLVGLAALTASFVWIAVLAGEDSFPVLIPGLLVYGAAQGFVFVPPLTAVMSSVPERDRGEAGGIQITAQMLGGTLAVAMLGTALIDGGYTEVFAVSAVLAAAVLAAAFALVHPPAERSG